MLDIDTKEIINMLIKKNICKFKLEDNNLIKFRYEYEIENKTNNIFIYFKSWNQFINIYNMIPDNKKHFYEIIDNKCKFFLDLDSKCEEIEFKEWNKCIQFIKNIIIHTFKEMFNKI